MTEEKLNQEAIEAAGQEEEGVEELIALLEQRASTYGMIARLYRTEIDEELLWEMHGMLYPTATGNADVDEGYRLIATFLSNLWSDSLTQLSIDYVQCFIGHGIDVYSAAYPFESVYTSEKRLMMQDARDEVLAVYRAYGVDKSETWKDSEDHIALELEFMQLLCNRTIEALREGDEDSANNLLQTQKNFLADHLLAWVPMMLADLKKFAKTDMYKGLGYLTGGFLDTDYDFLDDLLLDEAAQGD